MNAMQFDAMVVGNHEFDFGREILRRRIAAARFPVLGANVEGVEGLQPYILRELAGVKLGIIGVVTEETPVATHPRNVAGLKFLPAAEAAGRYTRHLRNRVDVIVLLSHTGYAADRNLAEKVPGIDVIVGGHSHTKIAKPARVGGTVVVQAWEHGKALGVLDLKVRDGRIAEYSGYLEEIRPAPGKEDRSILALVETYKGKVDAILNARVGETEVDLDGENVRKKETNLGNLLADIMRQASGADAAFLNGGGIRTSIQRGEIRVKDIYSVLPFDNYLVAARLTGKQVVAALEHGVSGIEEGEGRFPQVSGLTFRYSPSAPKGRRVKEVSIMKEGGARPLDPGREYVVATNDFLAAGGDGFKSFAEAVQSSGNFAVVGGMMKGEKVVYSDSGRWLRDVAVEYIREKKIIAPRVEGRIIEVR